MGRALTDAECLRRIRFDPEAICALYDRYLPRMVAALAQAAGDREVAWDIAQETFARTLELGHRVRLPSDASAWPWLWSVARNQLRDQQRRELVEARARDRLGIDVVPYDADAIDRLIGDQPVEALALALDRLPADQQRAIVGRVALDAGYEQLAEVFGTSQEAVRARVSRGLRTLRIRLSGGGFVNATHDPVHAYREELRAAARRRGRARRRRRLLFLAAAAATAVFTGLSLAATGWFQASPAPPRVISDFRAYTPQLGFHPEPGKAVFVAQDGAFKLYATTNREGTYCLVADLPWRHPQVGDGGVCVPRRDADQPLIASIIGIGESWQVVAGRADDGKARAIEFESPAGDSIEAMLGAGGFFIVPVRGAGPCPAEDWAPTFSALDARGDVVSTARILLTRVDRLGCRGPTIPHGPEVRRGPQLGKGPY